jgi:hypothetical protein
MQETCRHPVFAVDHLMNNFHLGCSPDVIFRCFVAGISRCRLAGLYDDWSEACVSTEATSSPPRKIFEQQIIPPDAHFKGLSSHMLDAVSRQPS